MIIPPFMGIIISYGKFFWVLDNWGKKRKSNKLALHFIQGVDCLKRFCESMGIKGLETQTWCNYDPHLYQYCL